MVNLNDFNPECITYSQMNMIFNARIYYRRLMNITRAYMRNRYYNLGPTDVLFDRLYLETLGIGGLLHLNFGRELSDQYSLLLSQFTIALRELISAQIEGNTEGINQSLQRLYDNVNTRADLLAAANPYWNAEEYRNLFGAYIQAIINEANALASGNLNEDIALYESLTELTNRFGDTLAEGIYNFTTSGATTPAQESGPCISHEQMRTIQNVRMFWFDFEVWARSYMVSRYLNIGDAEANFNRLKQVTVDRANEIKKIYGEQFSADSLRLSNDFIELIKSFIDAQLAGNNDEENRIIQLMYENTAARAALQASANPFLSEEEWRDRLSNLQVVGFINESTSLLSGDMARSLDIFTDLLSEAQAISDYFALALFNYFTKTNSSSMSDSILTGGKKSPK